MVKFREPTDAEKLDRLVEETARAHGLEVRSGGWARKTYDVVLRPDRLGKSVPMARVESYATTSGEVTIFDERALPFARDLGQGLEEAFGVAEAVLVRARPPR